MHELGKYAIEPNDPASFLSRRDFVFAGRHEIPPILWLYPIFLEEGFLITIYFSPISLLD
jgi:hypothetical protein